MLPLSYPGQHSSVLHTCLLLITCVTVSVQRAAAQSVDDNVLFDTLGRTVDVTYFDLASLNEYWPKHLGITNHTWINLSYGQSEPVNVTCYPDAIQLPDSFRHTAHDEQEASITVDLYTFKDLPGLKRRLIESTVQVDDWEMFYSLGFFSIQSSYNLVRHELLFEDTLVAVASYRRPAFTLSKISASGAELTDEFLQTFNTTHESDIFATDVELIREWGTHYISEATYGTSFNTLYVIKEVDQSPDNVENIRNVIQFKFTKKLEAALIVEPKNETEPECVQTRCFDITKERNFVYGTSAQMVEQDSDLQEWFNQTYCNPSELRIISVRLAPLLDYIDFDQKAYFERLFIIYYLNPIEYEISRFLPQKVDTCVSFYQKISDEMSILIGEMHRVAISYGSQQEMEQLFDQLKKLMDAVHLIDSNTVSTRRENSKMQWTLLRSDFFLCNCVAESANMTYEEKLESVRHSLVNQNIDFEQFMASEHDAPLCQSIFEQTHTESIDLEGKQIQDFVQYYKDECHNYGGTCSAANHVYVSLAILVVWAVLCLIHTEFEY